MAVSVAQVRLLFLMLVLSILCSCATARDAYLVDSLTTRTNGYESINPLSDRSNMQVVPTPFNLDTEKFPGADEDDESAYGMASDNADHRNRLMALLVERSEHVCRAHEAAIISNSAVANFSLGSITSVLTGLGTIFTPASTVRIMSGSAGIVNATRSEFNSVFYQNLLATAVVKAIEIQRVAARAELIARGQESIKQYSVDEMLADVASYHGLCSFFSGLVALTQTTDRVTSSSVELSSRIHSLQALIERNNKLAATASPANKKQIEDNNTQLLREINVLTTQLAVTRGGVAAPPAE